MDLFSPEALSALLTIILIDLVLAGDNALVIGLVARRLPKRQQRTVILWGTFGAVVARVTMAVAVVYILKIPGFLVIGGVALVWIARKLLAPGEHGGEHASQHAAAASLGAAIRTIVIADAVMGVDNVLAIGGVARESIVLLAIGLAISIPIVVWGSTLVIRMVDRFPSIILVGGAVLAWTAAKMIGDEPLLHHLDFAGPTVDALIVFLVFAAALEPWARARLAPSYQALSVVVPGIVAWILLVRIGAEYLGIPATYLQAGDLPAALIQFVTWTGWLPFALLYLHIARRRAQSRAEEPEKVRGAVRDLT